MAWFPDTVTEDRKSDDVRIENRDIRIGERVERVSNDVVCRSGRVLGFEPEGYARILLDNDQERVWSVEKLRPISTATSIAPSVPEPPAAAPTLALPRVPQDERTPPAEVPNDPSVFWRWSCYACTEWPGTLMVDAYHAYVAMRGAHHYCPPTDIAKFHAEYRRWWELTEWERDKRLHRCQIVSPNRARHRNTARDIVLGRLTDNSHPEPWINGAKTQPGWTVG